MAYATAGNLSNKIATSYRPNSVKQGNEFLDQLAGSQSQKGISWRWDDDYIDHRINAGLLFDLLGYLGKDDAVVTLLRKAELLKDPRPRMFAICSLLILGEDPESDALLAVAADAETRGILFTRLSSIRKASLFPASQLDQSKLAESDMVNWLTFGTELGRAPDHIELMKTVEIDTGRNIGGTFVYFIFRFKTDPPHWSAEDGWMAGISGPFLKKDFPTMHSWGDTFSTFTKWAEFDANEHLSSVVDLMERWREHHRNK